MADPGYLHGLLVSSSQAGEKGGLMDIHLGTIILTIVIFGLLVLLLGKFAWRPVLEAVRNRERRIRESLEKADNAKNDAEKALSEQKELLNQQRQEMADTLKQAREDAERNAQQILEKGRKEAESQAERARNQIEEERKRAIESVRKEAVEIALAAAAHLLKKTLDDDAHRQIVSEYIDGLPRQLQKH
jgi:F-type H+-transporting ATPase subunit b